MQETCRENASNDSNLLNDSCHMTPSGPGSTEQEPDVYMYISKLHQKCLAHPPRLNVPVPCSAMTRDTSPLKENLSILTPMHDKTAKQATISHASPL